MLDIANLNRRVNIEKVKASLDDIGGLKAPGPDGFPAIFFQKSWNLCKMDIFNLADECFREGIVPLEINHTYISLIPKVPSAIDMTQLRPISLCNTAYKVISKMIVCRLRHLIPTLIGHNQATFIPGGNIHDNIVIAQEILHKFRISKGKKGFIA
ncbi:hypothetical protein ACOSQ4_014485 [Xanthoceras sorbifolium]